MGGRHGVPWREWLTLVVLMALVLGIVAAVDDPSYGLVLMLLAVVLVTLAVVFARHQNR